MDSKQHSEDEGPAGTDERELELGTGMYQQERLIRRYILTSFTGALNLRS